MKRKLLLGLSVLTAACAAYAAGAASKKNESIAGDSAGELRWAGEPQSPDWFQRWGQTASP